MPLLRRSGASYRIDSLEKSTQIICFCSTAFYRIDSLEIVAHRPTLANMASYHIDSLEKRIKNEC